MNSKIEMPRTWSGASDNFLLDVALYRTCKLVDEWSTRHNAVIELSIDEEVISSEPSKLIEGGEDVRIRLVKRHYRVAEKTNSSGNEASLIWSFVHFHNKGMKDRAEKIAKRLLDAGYSQSAIDEVLNS